MAYKNGFIPTSAMVVRQGLYLWPTTAQKFDLMDAWLVSLGYPHMVISQPYGGYRSFADQVIVKKLYGAGAATPGYSNHGDATAWDINNISHYPDAIIAEAAVKFQLRRDAGNGHGSIESWHMHDYNQTVPAGGGATPITPTNPVIKKKDYDMPKTIARLDGTTYTYALYDGEHWEEYTDNSRAQNDAFGYNDGNSAPLINGNVGLTQLWDYRSNKRPDLKLPFGIKPR